MKQSAAGTQRIQLTMHGNERKPSASFTGLWDSIIVLPTQATSSCTRCDDFLNLDIFHACSFSCTVYPVVELSN